MTSCSIDWHSNAFSTVSYCFNVTLAHYEYALAGSCRIIVWLSIVCRTVFGHVWSMLTIDATCQLCILLQLFCGFRAQTDLALDDVDQATWSWIWAVKGWVRPEDETNTQKVLYVTSAAFISHDREQKIQTSRTKYSLKCWFRSLAAFAMLPWNQLPELRPSGIDDSELSIPLLRWRMMESHIPTQGRPPLWMWSWYLMECSWQNVQILEIQRSKNELMHAEIQCIYLEYKLYYYMLFYSVSFVSIQWIWFLTSTMTSRQSKQILYAVWIEET